MDLNESFSCDSELFIFKWILGHIVYVFLKNMEWPRLVWLSGLGIILQTKRSPVRFLGQGTRLGCRPCPWLGVCERQPSDVALTHQYFSPSLSPSLPLSLNINKYNLKQKQKRKTWNAMISAFRNMFSVLLILWLKFSFSQIHST